MPTPLVKKYADMYDVSVNKAEKEWNDSFDIAKDEYGSLTKRKSNKNNKIFGTTTNIFKNKMKKKYGKRKDEDNKIIYNIMRLKTFKMFNEQKENSDCNIELYVVAIDETEHWSDEIKEKIGTDGKIYAYYLYDASRATHLAEITPSYELRWLYNRVVSENELTEDEYDDIERNNGGSEEEDKYVHTNSSMLDKKRPYEHGSERDIIDACSDEDEYNDYIEKAIDTLRGNPIEIETAS